MAFIIPWGCWNWNWRWNGNRDAGSVALIRSPANRWKSLVPNSLVHRATVGLSNVQQRNNSAYGKFLLTFVQICICILGLEWVLLSNRWTHIFKKGSRKSSWPDTIISLIWFLRYKPMGLITLIDLEFYRAYLSGAYFSKQHFHLVNITHNTKWHIFL